MKRTPRHGTGSVVPDKRRGKWNFFYNDATGKRRSKLIGTRQQYPTKTSTWAAVERLRPKPKAKPQGDTMAALITRYENERIPTRHSTRRVYRSFLQTHILPRWGNTLIEDMQPREVELWLRGLELAPKTRSHLRNLLHVLLEFAMWAAMLPVQRNQMELVVVKGATKRVRKPRSLTVAEFHVLRAQLHEPFSTLALLSVCLGLRISEALGLRWCDIDWLTSTLSIRRAIVERHVDIPNDGELSRDHDVVQGAALAVAVLEAVDAISIRARLAVRQPHQDRASAVFLHRSVAGIAKGRGSCRDRETRNTQLPPHLSELAGPGWDTARRTAEAMRHSDIRTTMIYGDVVDGRISQALEKVSGLIFANSTRGILSY